MECPSKDNPVECFMYHEFPLDCEVRHDRWLFWGQRRVGSFHSILCPTITIVTITAQFDNYFTFIILLEQFGTLCTKLTSCYKKEMSVHEDRTNSYF